MEAVKVRRSALRMWGLALAGIPLLVIGADVLMQQRLLGPLQTALFPEDKLQTFEARDVIWAWALVAAGVLLVGFGLKELIFPRKVVVLSREGVRLAVAGPFRPAVLVPWEQMEEAGAERLLVEDEPVPALILTIGGETALPEQPWGARWLADGRLGLLASDWEQPAEAVAEQIAAARATVAASPAGEGVGGEEPPE